MTSEELAEILESLQRLRSEYPQIEAKRAPGGLPKGKALRDALHFANSPGGGVVLLGVDENAQFQIAPLDDPAKIQADFASLCNNMVPPLRPLIQLLEVDAGYILVAEIAELPTDQKPCFYQGVGLHNGLFIRVGDGDRLSIAYGRHLRTTPSRDAHTAG
jgi:ATP-dependent DNA helicase RecG